MCQHPVAVPADRQKLAGLLGLGFFFLKPKLLGWLQHTKKPKTQHMLTYTPYTQQGKNNIGTYSCIQMP